MNALVLLGSFLVFLLLRVPVAISMALAAFTAIWTLGICPFDTVASAAYSALNSYTLLAIPFYIFAGNMMTAGGISKALCNFAKSIFSRLNGGMGIVTVFASAFFAAISGSSNATTAAIGSMTYPEMTKDGYDKSYALSIAAAGGVIGPLIPPSISFVVYGVATNTSIGDLFIAGALPGILMAVFLAVTVYITATKRGYKGKKSDVGFFRALWDARYAVLVPVIILGGIYGGIFTPTEAGAVASIYTIIITMFVQKTANFKKLCSVLADSGIVSATIMFLMAMAGIFSKVMSLGQIPAQLTELIMSISTSKLTFLILVNVLFLICGCVMDITASIIILSPLLLPIAVSFGIDPIHFAIIECVNLGIGVITPPVGTCLFTATVIGHDRFENICRAIVPFLIADALLLLLLNCVPTLSTGILQLIGG